MNKLLISAFLIGLIITVSGVLAGGVELSAQGVVNGFTTEDKTIDVLIKNTQGHADTFTLTLFPSQLGKVIATLQSFLVTLDAGESKTVQMSFIIPIDAVPDAKNFEITAQSTSNTGVMETKNVWLNVQRLTSVYIPKLSLDKYTFNPGEDVRITADVYNLESALSGKNILKITVRKGTDIVKTFDESLDSIGADSSITLAKTFKLDKYTTPGSYVIEAELRGVQNELKYSKSINFNVNVVTADPTRYTSKSNSFNIVFTSVSLKIKNEGNVNLPAFTLTESVPGIIQSLFDPQIEPTTTENMNGRLVYTWAVPELGPGREYIVKYNIDIWRIWLTFIVVGGLSFIVYKWLSKPKINKLVNHEGEIQKGKEIVIMLEVKNRAWREIRNVEVVDLVPSILRVVDRFDTLRPKGKRTPEGMELRWRFESMKAGEERVLTYRVKPVVDIVGHLNLKSAEMIFTDNRKTKMSAVSKDTMVKTG